MLSLLTDEQISPRVAEQVRARRPELPIASVHHWREGKLQGQADALLLAAAHTEQLTLVTYDQKTIPPLLVEMAVSGQSHSGVILVDDRSIASGDIGGLVRALIQFWEGRQEWDWTDRVAFLEPV